MSRVSRGYNFEREVRLSFEWLKEHDTEFRDIFFMKFPDTRGFVIKPEQEGKYMPRCPSDHLMIFKGKPFFLEDKSTRNPASYAFAYIKDHQWDSGEAVVKAGGYYYFLLCNRAKRNHHRIYAVSLNDLKQIAINNNLKGRYSVKWAELDNNNDVIKIDRDKDTRLWLGLRGIFL